MSGNGAEVGSGHVSIFPVMTGFRSMVAKEMQASARESGNLFGTAFNGVGRKTGTQLGRDMKSAFSGTTGDLASTSLKKLESQVASAAKAMTNARLKQQDAAGKVKVAEAQLREAVAKSGSESAKAVAASERLASAKRKEQTTSEALASAEKRLKDAKQAVNDVKQTAIEPPKTGPFTSAVDKIKSSVHGLNQAKLNGATGEINGFAGAYQNVSGRIKASTIAIGSLIATGVRNVVSFGRNAINSYNQASEATAKFQQIASNNKWSANQVNGLLELNKTLGKTGVISAGTLKAAQAQLGTFKLTSDSVRTLTPALADLIANQKGYNATSDDGVQMANLLGKVMTGNVGALSRYGVTLDAAQKKLLQHGTESQRAAVAAQVLEQNFGGVNKALAATPYGKYVILQHQLAGIKTTIGSGFVSAIGALGDMGVNVVDTVNLKLQRFFQWLPRAVGGAVTLIRSGHVDQAFKEAFHVDSSAIRSIEDVTGRAKSAVKGLADFVRTGSFGKAFNDALRGMDSKTVTNFEHALSGVRNEFVRANGSISPVNGSLKGTASGMAIATRGVETLTVTLNILRPAIEVVSNVAKAFAQLPAPVQGAIGVTAIFGSKVGSVIGPIATLVKGISGMAGAIGSAAGKIGDFFSRKLFDATPIMHAERELSGLGSAAQTAATQTAAAGSKTEAAGKKAEGAFGGISLKGAAAGIAIGIVLGMVENKLSTDKQLADDFAQAMKGGADSYGHFMSQIQSGAKGDYSWLDKIATFGRDKTISDTLQHNGISFETFRQAVEGSGSAYQELQDKTGGVVTGMSGVNDAVNHLRDEYKKTVAEMVTYSQTQQAIANGTSGVQSAFMQLATTLKANGDNLAANGQLTNESQQAVTRATDALWQNVQAQLQYGKTSGDMATAVQQAKNSVQQMRDQLVQTLQQQGMSEQAANQYADSLGLIPRNVDTVFKADTDLSEGQIRAYLDTLGLTPSQKSTVMQALTAEADGDIAKLHENMSKLPQKVESILTADDTDLKAKTDDAKKQIKDVDNAKGTGKLGVDNTQVIGGIKYTRPLIESLDNAKGTGKLHADNSDVLNKTGQANSTLDAFNGKTVGSTERSDNSDVLNKTGQANSTLDAFNGKTVGSALHSDPSNAIDGANKASSALNGYNGKTATANINANDNASGVIQGVIDWIKKIPSNIEMFFTGHADGGAVGRANGGPIRALASGGPSGFFRGRGTTTSDSNPVLLSDQEFVIKAASARKIGIQRLQRMNETGKVEPVGAMSVDRSVTVTNNVVASGMDAKAMAAYLDLKARQAATLR
jgi:hypothetical protein